MPPTASSFPHSFSALPQNTRVPFEARKIAYNGDAAMYLLVRPSCRARNECLCLSGVLTNEVDRLLTIVAVILQGPVEEAIPNYMP
jgi:hypothetical protein